MQAETKTECETHLQETAKQYFQMLDDGATPREYLEWYVEHLLKEEIEYARLLGESEGRSRIPQQLCYTLVLLVGYSLEPLLQSIYVYQPHRIVLIANKDYHELVESPSSGEYEYMDGKCFVNNYLQPCIDKMVDLGLIQQPEQPEEVNPIQLDAAIPSTIFQALRVALRKQRDVVIDVTGGKKSMVTGAYLYAAFAQGVAISYVDFDDAVYDHRRGKPYGYRCRIGKLANPYEDFALRNWEQVRSLYRHYNFRAARELLIGKDGAKGDGTLWKTASIYLPGLREPIAWLAEVLEFYRLWDDGDYSAAYKKRSQTGFAEEQIPTAVALLGTDWARVESGTLRLASDFFDDNERLLTYAHDELARIRRLIGYNEDWRSAFLKAGGLNEVLMVSRWVRQCQDATLKRLLIEKLRQTTPNISGLFRDLVKPIGTTVRYELPRGTPPVGFPLTEQMHRWWKDIPSSVFSDWKDFTDLRNKLAHTYVSVPREHAYAALAFVDANFADFRKDKPIAREFVTDALPWSQLCTHCGLDEWLHPTLCADA